MNEDLNIRPGVVIPDHELHESASRSGGPGGQHVNTTSTKITLRWNLWKSCLREDLKARLVERLASRLTNEGELVIQADEHKSQLQNRMAARERLVATIQAALIVPKRRTATKPSRSSQKRRVDEKKARGAVKRLRGNNDND